MGLREQGLRESLRPQGLKQGGLRGSLRNLNSTPPEIPDSAIYRWKLDDVSSGSVSDSVGSAPDGTVNGVTSISGDYQGGSAGETTGADGDHIDLNSNLPDFESNVENGFAIGFTVDNMSSQSSFTEVFGVSGSDFNNTFRLLLNESDAESTDNVAFRLQESNSNFRAYTEPAGIFDGNKHRVLIGASISDGNVVAFVDNSNNDTTISQNNTSTWTSPGIDYYLFNSNFVGSTVDPSPDGVIDDFILYNQLPDANLAQNDFDLQPWT